MATSSTAQGPKPDVARIGGRWSVLGTMLPNWKFTGSGFLLAVFFAWFIELIYGLTAEAALVPGLRTFTLLWFASGAAFFVGTVGGFLFGVPKLAKSLLEPTLSAEKTEIN